MTDRTVCECCGEGYDPMTVTSTHWQCRDCEQWNEKDVANG